MSQGGTLAWEWCLHPHLAQQGGLDLEILLQTDRVYNHLCIKKAVHTMDPT